MTALHPCPFCGGNAFLRERETWVGNMRGKPLFQVQCGECSNGTSDRFAIAHYAVGAWNRRAPLSAHLDAERQPEPREAHEKLGEDE